MYKSELLNFISKSKKCADNQKSGATKLVAEILGISGVAVTNWDERIPMRRAMQLDSLLRKKETLLKYVLPLKGAPKFETDIYE